MLIGFAISAYLTFIICAIKYFLDQEKYRNELDRRCVDLVVNRPFIRSTARVLGFSNTEKWNNAFESAVLAFSDQQIVTGLAILVSGYVQLGNAGLAVYHWHIVIDLAWFSSVTHLTTPTCLRTYFWKNRTLAIVRVFCMLVIAVVLLSALVSIGYTASRCPIPVGLPAWCLYHRKALGPCEYNHIYVVILIAYLCLSYSARFLHLFKAREDLTIPYYSKIRDLMLTILGWVKNKAVRADRCRIAWILLLRAILSIFYVFQAAIHLFLSVMWEVMSLSHGPSSKI